MPRALRIGNALLLPAYFFTFYLCVGVLLCVCLVLLDLIKKT